jgi:hypothetical protein
MYSQIERVMNEMDELQTKMNALYRFINSTEMFALEPDDAEILRLQLDLMHSYSRVLTLRIARAGRGVTMQSKERQETVECVGCGKTGEPNCVDGRFYCGGSPSCVP